MKEFRPKLMLSCVVASVTLIAAFGAQAGFTAGQALLAAHTLLDAHPFAIKAKLSAHKTKPAPAPYLWSVSHIDSGLRLRGMVPSEDDRRIVLGMVKAHFPDLEVEDRLKVADGAPPKEQWLGAISFGLKQLEHLKSGSARLINVALRVDGEARSAADYDELKDALAGPLPTGLTIAGEDVKPPFADPFVFMADLGSDALSLSGSVPSEESRKQLRELSRQLFERPGLDDRLELASGAPTDWNEAVIASLKALSRLESGTIALSGLAVTIEGVAPDKGTALAVSYQLRRDLPSLFSTSESIRWKEARIPFDVASGVLPRIKASAADNEADWGLPQLPALFDRD
jgi:hypothetical protein